MADYLGLSMVLTTFAPLLLGMQGTAYFSHIWLFGSIHSTHSKLIILGFLLAIFPLGAFFFAPFWGALSDKRGRKPVLLFTLFKSFISYVIVCFGVFYSSLWLLFIGRLIGGIMAGNVTVSQSALIDLSDEKTKTKNLARMSMSIGFGFLFGPVIGGTLSDPNATSFVAQCGPYLFIAALFFILWALLFFAYKKSPPTNPRAIVSLLKSPLSILTAFSVPNIRLLISTWIGMAFGINLIQFCLAAYLVHTFQFSVSQISIQVVLFSTFFVLTNGLFIPWLSKKIKIHSIIIPGLIGLMATSLLLAFITNPAWLYPVMILWGIANGCIYGGFFPTISNAIPHNIQGTVMGTLWSINALAQVIEPSASGWLLNINYRLPFEIGSLFCLIAIISFFIWIRINPKGQQHV
jgi:MFS transporter, DHA1 family, tetracycline resistance protein